MRRFRLPVLIAALVIIAACGSSPEPVDAAVDDDVDLAGAPPAADELLPTGRAALAAATGEPHVLWFWGAH